MDDQTQPKNQRHTAKRIWDRLKAELAFRGGYTVVKDYVCQARHLSHPKRQSVLAARRNLKMARPAHAYVRGNTLKFYEWLDSAKM